MSLSTKWGGKLREALTAERSTSSMTGRALHMLYIEDDRVLGYQRMLPSMRPHLLTEVLPHLCEGDFPVGPHIWEWTRYCVTREHRYCGLFLSPAGNLLLSSIVEWGLASGVGKIIIEMNPLWLLRLCN